MIITRPQIHNQDEPEAIKTLSKHSIYKMLSADYFLPPRDSSGVSRTYLVGIYTDKYFRIEYVELKKFIAGLTPLQLKKAVYTTKAETYCKIERLLLETSQKELGFKSGIIPDGIWLYQIARYIDQYNTAGIFEVSLSNPNNPNADSHKVMIAKKVAEKEEILDKGLLKDKQVYSSIRHLYESHKRLVSSNLEFDHLNKYGGALLKKIDTQKIELEAALSNATLAVFHHSQNQRQDKAEGIWEEKEVKEREELRRLTEL